MWNGVVTNVGLNLLEQWASGGDVLTIEKATVGSGLVAQTNLRSSTYVQGEVGNAPIVASTPVTGGTQYRVQIQPAQNAAYVLHQVGIWAHLGNNGASTLLALYQEEDGISVPLQADQPGFLFTMYAIVTMSNTGEMTVNFDTSAYMTRSDFDAAMENYVTVTTFNTAIAGMVKGVNNGTSTATPDANGVVTLPTDSEPTEDSSNYVTSGGVWTQMDALSQRIGNVEQPAAVFADVAFSIAANAWTLDDGVYTYTYTSVLITATSGIDVFYDTSYRAALTGDIYVEKTTGGALFTTTGQPADTLTGTIRIIDSVNGVVPVERGGTGRTDGVGGVLVVDMGTISSLPTTKSVTGVTADMIVESAEFGTPGVFSGLTYTTAADSITISGTIASGGSSTVKLHLQVGHDVSGT